tara:strand:- start:58 stop:210 length:153 start_codon:yes stop_codon:yes gene_type:complete
MESQRRIYRRIQRIKAVVYQNYMARSRKGFVGNVVYFNILLLKGGKHGRI